MFSFCYKEAQRILWKVDFFFFFFFFSCLLVDVEFMKMFK